MQNATLRFLGLGLSAAMALIGCSGEGGDGEGNTPQPQEPTEFPDGSGQAAKTKAYAPAPYGVGVGSTAANYRFAGFANPKVQNSGLQPIEFADFYNPHADDPTYVPASPELDDRVYPADSPYNPPCDAGTVCPNGVDGNPAQCDTARGVCSGVAKPKALAVVVASVWCGPCNQEAKSVTPVKHAKYRPMGGEFILNLADGPDSSKAATQKNLYSWTTKYKVDFPAFIDPAYKLGQLFEYSAYPANMIIDTRCMKIVKSLAGVPPESYWTKFESVIKKSTCQ